MKRFFVVLTMIMLLPVLTNAQGNGQGKNKNTNTGAGKGTGKGAATTKIKVEKTDKQKHETAIWAGTKDAGGGGPKPSKNQPAKVRAAFQRDYPTASGVSWSKYRGDWTATFRNGVYWSTAVYHANGDRRDTRTLIPRLELPTKIEDIFKKKPEAKVESTIKINLPQSIKDLFRIKTTVGTTTQYHVYDSDGVEVQYNY